ncbi:hypothetical protein B0A79_10740 [Flavobacterium piscis]|jgi:hypothetical protein|uniref:Uncharacterized protein n=1 Tax=Flavobacterium piscis TaxID=1114874 RepID=A0ABX2XQ48_9FLAO|nr:MULTISPECIES: DUF6452 family protein [Flavobacterium]OCB77759.1 hypothetical protein FLP_02240 [Flavobacterium piscis]OXG04621.1 hypothetical protein B0A79_10740 [Flavobacterium piscis]QDW20849.1 hypothetical protein B0M43_0012245 [Flavobacterium sp. KBS0721]
MKKIISLLLVFTFGLSSCEKDDICDANTPTTPRLVISFYDINDSSKPRNVNNLMVIGEGKTEGIIFNKSVTDTTKYVTNANVVSVPLRTDTISTTYKFVYNSLSPNAAAINTDVIKIDYTHQNVYVSRACGFKTTFTLAPVNPFVRTDPDGDGNWMQEIFVKTRNIESENETHLEVYF